MSEYGVVLEKSELEALVRVGRFSMEQPLSMMKFMKFRPKPDFFQTDGRSVGHQMSKLAIDFVVNVGGGEVLSA